MRILHCIHSLVSGGAERQLRLLAQAHSACGVETGIVCIDDAGNDMADSSVRIFKVTRRRFVDFCLFGAIGHAIREFKPNVVHVWLPEVMTVPAMVMARVHRVPTVFSYRNAMYCSRTLAVVEYVCASLFASAVVSNNPVIRSSRWYRSLFRVKAGIEIPNAVHMPKEFLRKSGARGSDTPFTFLFVGRLTAQKNLECLLDALPLLKTERKWQLQVCGKGEQRNLLEKMVSARGLGDRVNLLGFRMDVYTLMQEADALVLPSWHEGMPNVLLEALAIGLPAIVSDIAAHRELVGATNSALMFDPTSPGQLAKQLDRLSSDASLASTMVSKGFEVASRYSLANMAEAYRSFYSRVAES